MNSGGEYIPALWVASLPRSEADALVRLLALPGGAVTALARGLLKPRSKLASVLKPGDELRVRVNYGRGKLPVLAGATLHQAHPVWQHSLDHTALCWLLTEGAHISAGDEELNSALFQLVVNLLRSEPSGDDLPAACVVYCLRLLSLHGLLPDLRCCSIDGTQLAMDEPAHLLPSGEGLIGREAYNRHYARTGGGMPRLAAARRQRWLALLKSPLLDYAACAVDKQDCALLVHMLAEQVAGTAGAKLRSAQFLGRQWQLPQWREAGD